jgi:hypothetical protein
MTNRQKNRRAEREENKITKTLPSKYVPYASKKHRITRAENRRLQRAVYEAMISSSGVKEVLCDSPYDK